MSCIVMQAISDDAYRLVQLMKNLEKETSFMMIEANEMPTIELMRRRIAIRVVDKQEVFLLAWCDNVLSGYMLAFRGNLSRNRGVGTLVLGVLQEYQGQGVGSQLMSETISWAQHNELYRLQFQVHVKNERALKLYLKFGFRIEGILYRCSFVNGEYVDKYQMALLL